MPKDPRYAIGCWLLSCMMTASAEDWPQWRGPLRDGHSPSKNLSSDWTAQPPRLLWTANGLGRGFASPSIVDNVITIMGDERGTQFVQAMRVESKAPEVLWRTNVARVPDVDYPGPRCTPTVEGNRLYALTTAGDLACMDRATGEILWKRNLATDFGGRMMSGWGYSESPLIDGEKVIVTPGGDRQTVVALDKSTGDILWSANVPNSGGASYASCVISEGAGVRQYITLLGRGLVGVDAQEGRLLWTYDEIANPTANIPTPIVRDDYVFASTGYGAGSALLRLTRDGDDVKAEEEYFLPGNKLQNHHGGMVLVGDHLYGGRGHNQGFPVCVEFKTGVIVWGERGPGQGSAAVTYADGHLYFRYQDGTVALVEATPEGYHLKGTFEIPDVSQPSWPHPVIVNGMLYLREQERLLCYDVGAH